MERIEQNHKAIDTLHNSLELDGLGANNIEQHCTVAFRMNQTPLTVIRNYLKAIGLGGVVEAHYIETDRWNAGTMDWIRTKTDRRRGPCLLLVACKKNGYVHKTRLFYISGMDKIRTSNYPRLKILR